MKVLAVIPARWDSSRFPGKPLAELGGKFLIQRVYEKAVGSGVFSRVIVATDDERIEKAVHSFGGEVVITGSEHKSGTDRVAEVCRGKDFEIVVNLQGDEPFITAVPLKKLISEFSDPLVSVASLMHRLESNIDDPNQVKVVFDINRNALYFSRSIIPFQRDGGILSGYWGHIGVYGFRAFMLEKFVNLRPGRLEMCESLEQLRLLENGIPIKMVATDYQGFGIDTPEDLNRAVLMLDPSSPRFVK